MRKSSLLFLLTAIILAALVALSACSQEIPTTSQSGYTATGLITLDGETLAGVTVLVDGVETTTSSENGIYIVRSLDSGAVLSFELDGYTFSPSTYTITDDIYDLNILATRDDTASGDDDTGSDTGTDTGGNSGDDTSGDTGDDTTGGDDTSGDDDTPVVEQLTAPTNCFFGYTASGNMGATFDVDFRSESVEIVVVCADISLSATATADVTSLAFGDTTASCAWTRAEDNSAISIAVDVTPLYSLFEDSFTITVSSAADGYTSSDTSTFTCAFSSRQPVIDRLALVDGTLSWSAENITSDCTFAVLINGVKVATAAAQESGNTTMQMSVNLSNTLSGLSGEFSVTVVALSGNDIIAVSPSLSITLTAQ